ncbi:Uncharacterised protein [Enterobacter hormaechei]|nr:Uncharacterised protein [Enterobacter hormaechei]SAE77106.1 Uncharacterised protein [Enterobacter hormaechei]SAH73834.1 Uncharacterised protein [Enterobacter hormaechei]VAK74109.1 Uncharacterised protein [Enterobacter hormaechei]
MCLKTGNIRDACFRLSGDHLPELFECRRVSPLLRSLAHNNISNSQGVPNDCFCCLLIRTYGGSQTIGVLLNRVRKFGQFLAAGYSTLNQILKYLRIFNLLQDHIGDVGYIDAGLPAHPVGPSALIPDPVDKPRLVPEFLPRLQPHLLIKFLRIRYRCQKHRIRTVSGNAVLQFSAQGVAGISREPPGNIDTKNNIFRGRKADRFWNVTRASGKMSQRRRGPETRCTAGVDRAYTDQIIALEDARHFDIAKTGLRYVNPLIVTALPLHPIGYDIRLWFAVLVDRRIPGCRQGSHSLPLAHCVIARYHDIGRLVDEAGWYQTNWRRVHAGIVINSVIFRRVILRSSDGEGVFLIIKF